MRKVTKEAEEKGKVRKRRREGGRAGQAGRRGKAGLRKKSGNVGVTQFWNEK